MKLEQLGKAAEARRILQVGKRDSIQKILINFKGMFTQNVIPEGKTKEDIKHAKILLVATEHAKQLSERGFFEVEVPFKDPCGRCKGTGAIYKLSREEQKQEEHDCESCDGKGYVWIPCRKCNGTGRFIRTNKNEDLRINCKCEACKKFENEWDQEGVPHFSYRVRCRDCRGEEKKARFNGIESVTICPQCSGVGFAHKDVWNPAMKITLAEKIEDVEVEDEATPVVDRVSDLTSSNQELIEQLFED